MTEEDKVKSLVEIEALQLQTFADGARAATAAELSLLVIRKIGSGITLSIGVRDGTLKADFDGDRGKFFSEVMDAFTGAIVSFHHENTVTEMPDSKWAVVKKAFLNTLSHCAEAAMDDLREDSTGLSSTEYNEVMSLGDETKH